MVLRVRTGHLTPVFCLLTSVFSLLPLNKDTFLEDTKQLIRAEFHKLPRNQKILAEYLLDNFSRIPFLNVQDISVATDTSVASVVRFAQRVGFKGYLELREKISADLQQQIHSKEVFPLLEASTQEDLLTSVANQDISNINDTLRDFDRVKFRKSVEMISKSDRIYIAGLGISSIMARAMAYLLTQIGLDARHFDHEPSSFQEQVLFLRPTDLLITFSFPPYSRETVETARIAASRKVKILSITNKDTAPVVSFSDLHLVVKSNNLLFTNSFSAISVMINAIATQCAMSNLEKSEKMVSELNALTNLNDLILPDDYLKNL